MERDESTLGVLFAFFPGVEVAFWSIALAQLTGHAERGSWRQALNPPIIAIPTAILLNALGAKGWMPASIETTFHLLALCAIPLALLLSGALIADHINKESLRHGSRTIFAAAAVRVGALPALFLPFTKIAPLDLALKSVLAWPHSREDGPEFRQDDLRNGHCSTAPPSRGAYT